MLLKSKLANRFIYFSYLFLIMEIKLTSEQRIDLLLSTCNGEINGQSKFNALNNNNSFMMFYQIFTDQNHSIPYNHLIDQLGYKTIKSIVDLHGCNLIYASDKEATLTEEGYNLGGKLEKLIKEKQIILTS